MRYVSYCILYMGLIYVFYQINLCNNLSRDLDIKSQFQMVQGVGRKGCSLEVRPCQNLVQIQEKGEPYNC